MLTLRRQLLMKAFITATTVTAIQAGSSKTNVNNVINTIFILVKMHNIKNEAFVNKECMLDTMRSKMYIGTMQTSALTQKCTYNF